MRKYEFLDEEKSIIRHNLVPEMLIKIIKLDAPNKYHSAKLGFDDIFDEILIRGWHFVFLILNDEDFEHLEDFTQVRSILKRAAKWYKSQVIAGFIPLKKYISTSKVLEDDNFKLMNGENMGEWLVAHKKSNFIIEFKMGYFNETQRVSNLSNSNLDAMQSAKILREMADWLIINHPILL